jgi:CheY-like chemotaxis protein
MLLECREGPDSSRAPATSRANQKERSTRGNLGAGAVWRSVGSLGSAHPIPMALGTRWSGNPTAKHHPPPVTLLAPVKKPSPPLRIVPVQRRSRERFAIRVVIADADLARHAECERLVREGRHLKLVAQAVRTEDVLPMVSQYRPRVLMLGLDLCDDDGGDPVSALHVRYPQTKVVLLAAHAGQEDRVLRALGNGASAYLTLETLRRQLCNALHGVNNDEAWVPRKMLGRILDRLIN